MGDDVLDAIIFMQQYYKNNESNSQVSETPKTPNIENNKIRHNTGCLTLKCAIVNGSEGWKDQ